MKTSKNKSVLKQHSLVSIHTAYVDDLRRYKTPTLIQTKTMINPTSIPVLDINQNNMKWQIIWKKATGRVFSRSKASSSYGIILLNMSHELSAKDIFEIHSKYWNKVTKYNDTEIEIDIFLANNSNFGIIFLVRTVGITFNKDLTSELKTQGHNLHNGALFELNTSGNPMNLCYMPTGKIVFRAADTKHINPESRY